MFYKVVLSNTYTDIQKYQLYFIKKENKKKLQLCAVIVRYVMFKMVSQHEVISPFPHHPLINSFGIYASPQHAYNGVIIL